MTTETFQNCARRTVPERVARDAREMLINGALGLCGEAGEVSDLIKKHIYQGHELKREKLIEELGDVCWYISMLCDAAGVTIGEVMEYNVEKLKKRYSNGFSAEESINRVEYRNGGEG